MEDGSKTRLRDEIAALSETVRDLRDEVARLRAVQHAPCSCVHIHPAWQPAWWQPNQVWCGGAAAGNTGTYTINNTGAGLEFGQYQQAAANNGCAGQAVTTTYTVSL